MRLLALSAERMSVGSARRRIPMMRGIRRTYGSAKVRKAPAVAGKMLGMVATAPDRLSGLRDRALLLLGLAGALRRSELVALDVADIEETEKHRPNRLGVSESSWHIDSGTISQRHNGADTRHPHQAPAHLIVPHDGQQTAVQDGELLAQYPPYHQQRFHQNGQIRQVLDKLLMRASNFTVPTMPTLRPKLRKVPKSLSMAMALDCLLRQVR
jgi:integrase